MARPIIGILGGMGPAATADLYTKLIAATPATRDQEHLHVIIWADPSVPDRTDALLHGGADPMPLLLRGARALAADGADLIAIPCNTAHAFLSALARDVAVPFLDMMEETASFVELHHPTIARVGLLATSGTCQVGLYQEAFARHHVEVVVPPDALQERCVTAAIRRVKMGDSGAGVTALLQEAAAGLVTRGAEAVITGCTELPLVFHDGDAAVPVIDPTAALAAAIVRRACASQREDGGR